MIGSLDYSSLSNFPLLHIAGLDGVMLESSPPLRAATGADGRRPRHGVVERCRADAALEQQAPEGLQPRPRRVNVVHTTPEPLTDRREARPDRRVEIRAVHRLACVNSVSHVSRRSC